MKKYLVLCAVAALALAAISVGPEPAQADATKVLVCHFDVGGAFGHLIDVADNNGKNVQKHIDEHGDCIDGDIVFEGGDLCSCD